MNDSKFKLTKFHRDDSGFKQIRYEILPSGKVIAFGIAGTDLSTLQFGDEIDFDKESDIDLFIDTLDKKAGKKIKSTLDDYYKTQKYKNWNLKGIDNAISIIAGELNSEEWKNLKRAIMNTGIILYGKYKSSAEKINQYSLISFENIKPDKKRVALYRKIFGFTLKDKKYSGLSSEWDAIKVGKGCLMIPIEHTQKALQFFKEKKINLKIYDLWSDSKFIS